MPSSPWPPAAGAPPPQQRAAQGTVSTVAPERLPVEGSRSGPAKEEDTARLPSVDYYSELKTLEHAEKTKKYQGKLAARLKAKYFSNKTFEEGYVFEEIVIESKTVRLSRWPFTRLFADPARFCREKSSTEKGISRPLAGEAMPDD
ncbi:uncharacterized protein LOC100381393 [Zea mays]|uniref:Uncharacterized protein n=1 Tax=Zea mays TaxID=4577 RepID=A0A1D6KHY9_MAIZE|nr:uncharacterized protein LOC100381393 [Zea mays]ONM02607.1 hypothetical protein ZEAMMB73_Zm00001d031271 [Zea mays]ONM02609.1 hypothetical protein ZEAMMB73_Zm00001d031271 [Zea mays]|eukprot:NP_001167706.2 uncharacterized protein LOC100381393 [Zea mays]